VAYIGAANNDSEAIICELGQTRRLGRLDVVTPLTPDTLDAGFRHGFDADVIRRELTS
jgi:dethiobiotin synthetase